MYSSTPKILLMCEDDLEMNVSGNSEEGVFDRRWMVRAGVLNAQKALNASSDNGARVFNAARFGSYTSVPGVTHIYN